MDKIKVLVVEPEKEPYLKEIDNEIKTMQKLVNGYIETVFLTSTAVLVCNDEGMINGSKRNRSYDFGFIYGTFFIAGIDEPDFASLNDLDIKKYTKKFGLINT
ncbi:MAG: DUF3846 domain-containing protein [Oscillospiraceae bacterium]|nr:DUF3846 domain-containing protein [Oscillospiraceae bacterium]